MVTCRCFLANNVNHTLISSQCHANLQFIYSNFVLLILNPYDSKAYLDLYFWIYPSLLPTNMIYHQQIKCIMGLTLDIPSKSIITDAKR